VSLTLDAPADGTLVARVPWPPVVPTCDSAVSATNGRRRRLVDESLDATAFTRMST
jgi:hypothetical protein